MNDGFSKSGPGSLSSGELRAIGDGLVKSGAITHHLVWWKTPLEEKRIDKANADIKSRNASASMYNMLVPGLVGSALWGLFGPKDRDGRKWPGALYAGLASAIGGAALGHAGLGLRDVEKPVETYSDYKKWRGRRRSERT